MNIKKNTSSKKNRDPRRMRIKAISTALTIVVIVGIILLNVIVSAVADRYPFTIDTSSDKMFTLSEDAKSFAKSVKNEVEVVVLADPESYFLSVANQLYSYYQVDFSRQLERVSREVSTALNQLNKHSDGKITYTFINPDQEPEKYAKYEKYNVDSEYNLLFISGERYQKDSLGNMAAPMDTYTVNSYVEKVLISKINALQGDNDRIIQVLTGHKENEATIAGIKRLYELNGYIFEDLDITGSAEISEHAEVLLIAAPQTDYTDTEVRRISNWLENDTKRNHHLMVFVDPDKPVSEFPNLYGMLKDEYKIEITDQRIYETDSNLYFSDGESYNPEYVWADIPSNQYTSNAYGGAVKAPGSRRLLCSLPSSATSTGIEEWGLQLVSHSDTARVKTLGSDAETEIKADEYPLISAVSYVYETQDNNNMNEDATTTVTVFGSAAMAYGAYIQDYSTNNEELLLDVIHSVTGYQSDIAISDKVFANDVTQFTARAQMTWGIWVFTVGLPVVVLVICLVVFLRRRSL